MVNLSALNPFGPTVQATTEISQLRVYPIKSCRGVMVNSTVLTRKGLDLDRNWMFVNPDKDNKFQTIREISQLTLVDTALATPNSSTADGSEDDLELVLSIRNKPEERVRIPARPSQEWLEKNTKLVQVEIWGQKTDGWIYGDEVNKMFQDLLQKPVALVYKGPTPRLAGANGRKELLGRDESVNFPDFLPILITNEQSIKELNSQLKKGGHDEITIERFRPNIVVKGDGALVHAWAEDEWKTVRVINGSVPPDSMVNFGPPCIDIDVCMHCARCQVPNVNPDTAEKHPKQPWDTLVSYRRIDEGIKFKPCFGMLCCPRTEGPVQVGMKLEVLETTKNHVFNRYVNTIFFHTCL